MNIYLKSIKNFVILVYGMVWNERIVCEPKKYKCLVGYSTIYHSKALHN